MGRHRPAQGADAYTAHWYDGRVWVNDMNRGLEVLRVEGLGEGAWQPVATPPGGNAAAQLLARSFTPSVSRPCTAAERGPTLFCTLR